MECIDDIFVNEDVSKPENRVNLALFSVMQQDWFREWFLKKLDLQPDAVVYPPMNVGSRRPDFRVKHSSAELAMIEVELGTDLAQAEDYREQFGTVKTVWGRRADGGDLSLEEIADFLAGFLEEPGRLSPQPRTNVKHLSELIKQGLAGHSPAAGRGNVSEEMWQHSLVVALRCRLGARLEATTKRVAMGQLKADTVGKKGFSLKVNRRDKSGDVALISINGGGNLIFPSRQKLNRCLPNLRAEVDAYMSLVSSMGCKVDVDGDNASPRLPLEVNLDAVLGRVNELARYFKALA